MLFFSNFFNFNTHLRKLEQQAEDVLELQNGFKAYRSSKEVVIVDASKNKIVQRFKNTFPSNSKRAILEITKQLNIVSDEIKTDVITKKTDVWTCGFRDNEARWVWYKNSEPKMTVSFDEAYKSGSLEDRVFFFSARYGTSIISRIKVSSLEKVAKEINAFILEHSYVKVACTHCSSEENYTIDDLVDSNKAPDYLSKNVVCQHCNELIKLL
jgi:hypothetical protein